jgi:glycosyltransferase involved in cell wall biosynthesis
MLAEGGVYAREIHEFRSEHVDPSGAERGYFRGQINKPQLTARRPKVSILLITYNHEKYIAQALESVLMQEAEYTYEINVIEDCSTDRTQEIVMQYVRKYPQIVKPYFNAKNIGFKVTQKNFYRGFRTLTGDYFAILEGDDYWSSPYKLQKQVEFLEANPDFAICAGNTVKIYEDGSKEPHRFLYWGRQDDGAIEDVIKLRRFFHTTGVMYRNVFEGVPPRHYRNKWSCDIFIMISHAQFGKVHHLDEDMAVYRAHAGGRFSNMPLLDAWIFNIDGLRRYNAWLGYRYCKTFAEAIAGYCTHVLTASGKGEAASLSRYQFTKILSLRSFYRIIYQALDLPRKIKSALRRLQRLPGFTGFSKLLGLQKLPDRTRLAKLPKLPGSAEWELIWGLNVKAIDDQEIVADQLILKLTAVPAKDRRALDRHALCERLYGFLPGSAYRVTLSVKPVADTNVHIQLRDSIVGQTGKPTHEADVWFDLSSQSAGICNGDVVKCGIEQDADGWLKVWVDFVTADSQIYVYLGLAKGGYGSHTFEGAGEQVLLGGIEVYPAPWALIAGNVAFAV